MVWQLQDAKNKFSQVINTSLKQGPQVISRHGQKAAVILSFEDYQRLIKPKKNLKRLLSISGYYDLDIERDKSRTGRASNVPLK